LELERLGKRGRTCESLVEALGVRLRSGGPEGQGRRRDAILSARHATSEAVEPKRSGPGLQRGEASRLRGCPKSFEIVPGDGPVRDPSARRRSKAHSPGEIQLDRGFAIWGSRLVPGWTQKQEPCRPLCIGATAEELQFAISHNTDLGSATVRLLDTEINRLGYPVLGHEARQA